LATKTTLLKTQIHNYTVSKELS